MLFWPILSFDIEKQEVIELPLQTGIESIKFINDNSNSSSEIPPTFERDASKEVTHKPYLPPEIQTDNESSNSAQEITTEESSPETNTDRIDVRSDQVPNDDEIDK